MHVHLYLSRKAGRRDMQRAILPNTIACAIFYQGDFPQNKQYTVFVCAKQTSKRSQTDAYTCSGPGFLVLFTHIAITVWLKHWNGGPSCESWWHIAVMWDSLFRTIITWVTVVCGVPTRHACLWKQPPVLGLHRITYVYTHMHTVLMGWMPAGRMSIGCLHSTYIYAWALTTFMSEQHLQLSLSTRLHQHWIQHPPTPDRHPGSFEISSK